MKRFLFPFIFIGGAALLFLFSCSNSVSTDPILKDSVSISKGALLFHQNCSGCHNFKQDGIGPNLSGITEEDTLPWIKQFIRSPKSLIDSGEDHAKELFADYHTLMPSFSSLKDDELDQLIAFIHTHKGIQKQKPDPLAIKDPVPEKVSSSGLEAGLELMAQIPFSSDKEPLTRISKMDWLDAAKAWFILDQRGKIYKLSDKTAETWFDISKWKPNFINQPGLATGLGSFAFHPDYKQNGVFYTTH